MNTPQTIARSVVVAALDSLGIEDRPFLRVMAVRLTSETISIEKSNGERSIWRIVDECASCHAPEGRPHTEYCPVALGHITADEADRFADYDDPPAPICTAPRDALPGGRPCSDDNCPVHAEDEPDHATHDTACPCPACTARPYLDPAGPAAPQTERAKAWGQPGAYVEGS
ncbi:hypothetical protein [Kribbella catacumbae]|uniref:hypothetical protein n=1 Tax=Kribbella catacumbae TaxID=460086 RepID=UPI000371B301|nr:hypothetical protein [Kribbella catacumbae]